jgi:ferritin-like metal-binding protein YciE
MKTQAKKTTTTSTQKENEVSWLEKFFVSQLKDIYYVEQQLLKALDEFDQACTSEELGQSFQKHRDQTERHIKRLEKVFEIVGQKPQAKKCESMEGLLKEARSIIKETKEGTATRDAALIIGAQKIEHYEIATYGSLLQLAITMDLHPAAQLLDKTLQEEEMTDHRLTFLAESYINVRAENEKPFSWQKSKEMEFVL